MTAPTGEFPAALTARGLLDFHPPSLTCMPPTESFDPRDVLDIHFDQSTDQASRGPGLRGQLLDWLTAELGGLDNLSVVDLLSGPGLIGSDLVARGATSYLGLDTDLRIVEAATRYHAANTNLH